MKKLKMKEQNNKERKKKEQNKERKNEEQFYTCDISFRKVTK